MGVFKPVKYIFDVELLLCTDCGQWKEREEYYKQKRSPIGVTSSCKECHRKTSVRTRNIGKKRKVNREYAARAKKKDPNKFLARRRASTKKYYHTKNSKARRLLSNEVRAQRIIRPNKCFACGEKAKVQAHHEDYDKPLDIVWLCHSCHVDRHYELRS